LPHPLLTNPPPDLIEAPTRARSADRCCAADASVVFGVDAGSRRRRLWQLDPSAHCPVLGVCLPIGALRQVVANGVANCDADDDYRLHCLGVGACKERAPVSEALHKELERRYSPAVRRSAAAKSAAELSAWWRDQRAGEDMPGALWATLTHARCDALLEQKVLADVHMLQHQRGASQRVDRVRFEVLQKENAALRGQLEALMRRNQGMAGELALQREQAQAQHLHARAQAIGRDTAMAALRDELQALQAQLPDWKSRAGQDARVEALNRRVVDLERALQRAEQQLERERQRVAEPAPRPDPAAGEGDTQAAAPAALGDRAVLCVGGRPASVPLYRHIVERQGGRFLHHDGGDEQSAQQLDATLSAADLVICQTGCVSHGAYWRVKDHCKRHGKPCVFVEKPGSAGLKRALAALQT